MELINSSFINDANLISYYRMEGNSNDSKASNNGTDTTMSYGENYGRYTQGANFNGTGYITYGAKIIPTGAKTVAFWMKSSAATTFAYLIGQSADAGTQYGFSVYVNEGSDGKLKFVVTKANVQRVLSITTAASVADGNWHFVACVWDGTTNAGAAKLYIDLNSAITATATSTETTTPTNNLKIGAAPGGSTNPYTGYLDEVSIFSRALTADEVTRLYNEGGKPLFFAQY